MSKIASSTKMISLMAFVAVAAVFYYFISANGSLNAANEVIIKDEKGMTVEEFQKRISQKDKLVFVYFNASWCVPCLKLKPEIAELEKDTKDICEILQINVDDHPQVAEYYEINSLPMFVLYKNGKKLWENIGILTKTQLQSKIESFSK
jgi:thioredoxin